MFGEKPDAPLRNGERAAEGCGAVAAVTLALALGLGLAFSGLLRERAALQHERAQSVHADTA